MFTSEVIEKMSKSEVELSTSNQEKRVEDVKSNENIVSSDNQSIKASLAFDFDSETINYRGRNDFDPSQANFEDFMFSMLMNS